MRMNDVPNFPTSDLGLAAALKTVGFKLLSLEPTDGRRAALVLENEHGIDRAAQFFLIVFIVACRPFRKGPDPPQNKGPPGKAALHAELRSKEQRLLFSPIYSI